MNIHGCQSNRGRSTSRFSAIAASRCAGALIGKKVLWERRIRIRFGSLFHRGIKKVVQFSLEVRSGCSWTGDIRRRDVDERA